MQSLSSPQIAAMFLTLGVLLTVARVASELAQRFRQPAVLGEILAGILLGPTILGRIAPELQASLFPTQGPGALVLNGFATFSIVLYLLVAGMEVDLSTVWKQGRTAVSVGVLGIVVPFTLGLGAAHFAPGLLGRHEAADPTIFTLFLATAFSISALPVIVRTLMDLHIYRSDIGAIVVASAIFDDLVGWIVFAIVLGLAGAGADHSVGIGSVIGWTIAFIVIVLTAGRWWVHRALLWIQAYSAGPGAMLGFALSLGLFGAACTEAIGIHAIFGAFMIGVAIGDSSRLRERTRATLTEFTSFIFAPVFFASIGLKVDFLAHFHWLTVLAVLGIACTGKLLGCTAGARFGGLGWREAFAVGAGMNVRGAMEIILGTLALEAGIIGERLFVALVVMALATSLAGGPLMARILRRRVPRRMLDFLGEPGFVAPLTASTRREAIRQLVRPLARLVQRDPQALEELVWTREQLVPTGLSDGLAVPHARVAGLRAPLVALGISQEGIDFNSQDGLPARLIFLLLTPEGENTTQLELLGDIARTFGDEPVRRRAMEAESFLEFVAAVREVEHRSDGAAVPAHRPPATRAG